MSDEKLKVEGFEIPVDLLLEDDEEVSAAALTAAEILSDREEFDALVLGETYLGDFSKRVAESSRTPVAFGELDEVQASEEALDDALFRAANGFAQEPDELPVARVFKTLTETPEYQRARAEFVDALTHGANRTFAKRATTEKAPKCCAPSMIRCGEGTHRVERHGTFVTEYDSDGNLLRGYSVAG